MLSPDEHSGIFTFLVGIVVVVLVSVGLATVVESRRTSSSGGRQLEREVEQLDGEVVRMQDQVATATARLAALDAPRRASVADALRETKLESTESLKRKEELLVARERLRDANRSTEQEFLEYRDAYRVASREAAVGEDVGTLTLRDGRSYLEVSITKVTDVGLEIRHQHGFARIHAPDLGPDWQDRFQWDDEERRTRLKEEALAHERMSLPKTVANAATPNRRSISKAEARPTAAAVRAADQEDLAALRKLFSAWQTKVSRLESERNEALSESMREKSVPGRLETWQERAERLGRELSKARKGLSAARARLAEISPSDPVFVVPPASSR